MPASPLVASTLNRSQIEAWEVTHLQTVAAHWTETAQTWEGQFTTIHNGMLRPGGTLWEGTAADAAADQTFGDLVAVRGAAHALHSAAVIARNGADDIAWAKRQVVTAITEAEDAGFTVGDDLTVTEKSQGWLRISESRKRQMQEFATEITSRAKTLVSVDNKVAGQITAALSALEGLSFPDKGSRVTNRRSRWSTTSSSSRRILRLPRGLPVRTAKTSPRCSTNCRVTAGRTSKSCVRRPTLIGSGNG